MFGQTTPQFPCSVCNKPVGLESDTSTDENGKAVHTACCVQGIATPPFRHWRQIAADAAKETDPRRLSELVQELIRNFKKQELTSN